jgi:hypothetical protein
MGVLIENLPRDGTWVYLYVLAGLGREHEPLRPVKIGITGNMPARLAAVQTGSPRRLHAAMVINIPNREIARTFESAFHSFYAGKRLQGEWFDIDPIDAMSMVCVAFKDYFERGYAENGGDALPQELCEMIGLPHWEREIKVLRAWRQYYSEKTNVVSFSGPTAK